MESSMTVGVASEPGQSIGLSDSNPSFDASLPTPGVLVRVLPLAPLTLLLACTDGSGPLSKDSAGDSGDTTSPPESCGYTPAQDLDPAEGIVEVDLTASALAWDPGTGTPLDEGMAYAGQVPGPLIEADVGETILAHFVNDLDVPLIVHWHGLRIDDSMDGGMMQMMDPVEPGESFDYRFTPPDAGFYWYHPHINGATTIERGLYGPMIIHGPGEGTADCDLPLMLDDILLDEDTLQVAPPDTDMMQLMGRLGNVLLANARTDRRYPLINGQTVLLRLANPSNARYWDVYVEGQDLTVVGSDGGWLAEPYPVESIVIVPGERYMVTFTATGEPGEEFRLMNKRFQLHDEEADMVEVDPLGNDDNPVLTFVLGDGEVTGTPWVQPPSAPPTWTGATETLGHHWVLDEDMMGGTVTIDGASWPDVPLVSVSGDLATTFEVENKSEMHHPFHIHGNNYQVVAVNGVAPTTPPAWKDTWDLPPYSTVTVVSDLSNPGDWMYHCHVLEHQEAGMMGEMVVTE